MKDRAKEKMEKKRVREKEREENISTLNLI